MRHNSQVLGIEFPEESFMSVLQKVEHAWQYNSLLRISTVNPEFLVRGTRDPEFQKNIQEADVKTVDGFGLWLILYSQGWRGKRITGAALLRILLRKASIQKKKVIVVIAKEGLSSQEQVKAVLTKKHPQLLSEVLYEDEYRSSEHRADITFIATGAPVQEYLSATVKQGVVLGVGGAIDFLTGTQKRAPQLLQIIGIEWLWRLILQPSRIIRIWNAIMIFPLLALQEKKK